MSNYRHFTTEQRDGVIVLKFLDPSLSDALAVMELQDELLEMLDDIEPHDLVVDFAEVKQCSTAVINGLLRAKKRLLAMDRQMRLCAMNEAIREAYRMLNLDGTVFAIDATVEDSLKSL